MSNFLLIIIILCGFSGFSRCEASSLQNQVEAETIRREQQLKPLQEAYDKSRKLVADGNGTQACEELEKAYQVESLAGGKEAGFSIIEVRPNQ